MKQYKVTVRFMLYEEYDGTENYDVEISENTKEDDIMTALMDATRTILQKEFEGNENWEDGNYNWTIVDFEEQ